MYMLVSKLAKQKHRKPYAAFRGGDRGIWVGDSFAAANWPFLKPRPLLKREIELERKRERVCVCGAYAAWERGYSC